MKKTGKNYKYFKNKNIDLFSVYFSKKKFVLRNIY